MAGALVVVVIIVLIILGQLMQAKGKKLPPGEKAPWTGRYEAPQRAWSGKGSTLPPTASKGSQWQLKEAYSPSSSWIPFALILAVLALLCYSQVDTSQLQDLISSHQVSEPRPAPAERHHVTAPVEHHTAAAHGHKPLPRKKHH
jgi:hypothetical protein